MLFQGRQILIINVFYGIRFGINLSPFHAENDNFLHVLVHQIIV